jgi:superfamily II DNA or RNA helicase
MVRRVVIERRTAFDPAVLPTDPGIQEILGAVAADSGRTQRLAEDVLAQVAEGRYPLVLTERRQHLDARGRLLEPSATPLVMLHGGMGVRARRRADALLATDAPRIVLATGRYIGEDFDDPRLDTLVLAMPVAWNDTVTEYAGRLQRHHDAKREIRILDCVDHEIPVLRRMYAKRRAGLRTSLLPLTRSSHHQFGSTCASSASDSSSPAFSSVPSTRSAASRGKSGAHESSRPSRSACSAARLNPASTPSVSCRAASRMPSAPRRAMSSTHGSTARSNSIHAASVGST